MLTLAAVADHKNITIGRLDVHIGQQIEEGRTWRTAFQVRIDLGPDLTRRERTILFNSARFCEVSKLLAGEKTFAYELVPDAPPTAGGRDR